MDNLMVSTLSIHDIEKELRDTDFIIARNAYVEKRFARKNAWHCKNHAYHAKRKWRK